MALLVLGYPSLDAADHRWIQAFRADHDPQFRIVAPHFTLVFPVEDLPEDEMIAHVRRHAKTSPKVPFTLRCALPVADAEGSHLFLVPDEGFSALVKLHDRLYTDCLAPYLRLDMPFVPHITVGQASDRTAILRLAAELNTADFAVQGVISRLTVVRFVHGLVSNLVELPLLG